MLVAIDTNVLVHAHRRDSSFHAVARQALDSLSVNCSTWAIPWPCLHEFLAVVTNPRVFRRATPVEAALDQIDAWLASPTLMVLGETEEHWPMLSETVRAAGAVGGLVHDARIMAICREHGVSELWTADRDFSRFHGLATFNPLEDGSVHEAPPDYGVARRARAAGRRRVLALGR